MKIIGVLDHTYTVQISRRELEALTGSRIDDYGHMLLPGRTREVPVLSISEFKICEGWERLKALNANRAELNKAIRQLRAVADVLEPLELVVAVESSQEELETKPTN